MSHQAVFGSIQLRVLHCFVLVPKHELEQSDVFTKPLSRILELCFALLELVIRILFYFIYQLFVNLWYKSLIKICSAHGAGASAGGHDFL